MYSIGVCHFRGTNPNQMFLWVYPLLDPAYILYDAFLGIWYFGRIVTLGSYY